MRRREQERRRVSAPSAVAEKQIVLCCNCAHVCLRGRTRLRTTDIWGGPDRLLDDEDMLFEKSDGKDRVLWLEEGKVRGKERDRYIYRERES